jgi:hypothetical protein
MRLFSLNFGGFCQLKTLVFFSFILFSCADEKKELKPIKEFTESELKLIKEGDIVLKNGYGTLSKTIVKLLDEKVKISHCGFLFWQNDSLFVLHSIAKEYSDHDGVQKIPIHKFLNDTKPNSLYVVRLKEDANTKENVLNTAFTYYNNKVPFDYDFNNSDDCKLYCSEFVYQSIKNSNTSSKFDFKDFQGKKILLFNSFFNEIYFEQIVKR